MSSVCDDCEKKIICKPSREYHFACQWKPKKDEKEKIDGDWGIPPIVPKESYTPRLKPGACL